MSSIVDVRLGDYHGEWILDNGVVRYVEHIGSDVIEAELEGCGEDYTDCVIEDVVKRLGDELKLPRSILGSVKARLKVLGLPLVITLREEVNVSIIEFRGRNGNAQLVIHYQLIS
ncbi:hypothetical protein [Vulcanisaeta distributa]|uniref:Uncharacterized protein n=1 Tax=Vulcanisaeta distributa (strain DSM 14429 / JCM 11212 / NBRC 100878 / IC-017) TaxID=572478 RepID=E1QNG7_VULDI|nr:hypothetical protein [Vulcanisaeta distributa]ADN50137.1 hypothetical protein Vdis_0744 [Vulcanisaeta distributa DSM 14429]